MGSAKGPSRAGPRRGRATRAPRRAGESLGGLPAAMLLAFWEPPRALEGHGPSAVSEQV